MWREKYHFHYKVFNNLLWLLNVYDDHIYFSMPLGNYDEDSLKESLKQIKEHYGLETLIVKKAEESFVDFLDTTSINHEVEDVRNDYDYLYDFEELKGLKGNKYHKKKNHVNYFIKHYDYLVKEINDETIDDVKIVMNNWFEDKTGDVLFEQNAILEGLKHFKVLGLMGIVIYVDNQAVGFTIGEKVNNNTLLIHYEKGNTSYKGIYPSLSYLFLQELDGYDFINREQDLGIEGLRKSKLSYHPVDFVKKYNVKL
jgi:hypothetical protein